MWQETAQKRFLPCPHPLWAEEGGAGGGKAGAPCRRGFPLLSPSAEIPFIFM